MDCQTRLRLAFAVQQEILLAEHKLSLYQVLDQMASLGEEYLIGFKLGIEYGETITLDLMQQRKELEQRLLCSS